jgi:hypothetical protein
VKNRQCKELQLRWSWLGLQLVGDGAKITNCDEFIYLRKARPYANLKDLGLTSNSTKGGGGSGSAV